MLRLRTLLRRSSTAATSGITSQTNTHLIVNFDEADVTVGAVGAAGRTATSLGGSAFTFMAGGGSAIRFALIMAPPSKASSPSSKASTPRGEGDGIRWFGSTSASTSIAIGDGAGAGTGAGDGGGGGDDDSSSRAPGAALWSGADVSSSGAAGSDAAAAPASATWLSASFDVLFALDDAACLRQACTRGRTRWWGVQRVE